MADVQTAEVKDAAHIAIASVAEQLGARLSLPVALLPDTPQGTPYNTPTSSLSAANTPPPTPRLPAVDAIAVTVEKTSKGIPKRSDTGDSGYGSAVEEDATPEELSTILKDNNKQADVGGKDEELSAGDGKLEQQAHKCGLTLLAPPVDAPAQQQYRHYYRPGYLRSYSMMNRNAMANPGASLYKPRWN